MVPPIPRLPNNASVPIKVVFNNKHESLTPHPAQYIVTTPARFFTSALGFYLGTTPTSALSSVEASQATLA